MRRARLLGALLATACGASEAIVPPIHADAKSALLAIERGGELSITLLDLSEPDVWRLEVEGLERLELASFRETIAELRMTAGTVSSSLHGPPLPQQLAAYEALADGFDWTERSALGVLAEFRRPEPRVCRTLEVQKRWVAADNVATIGLVPRSGGRPPLVLGWNVGPVLETLVLQPDASDNLVEIARLPFYVRHAQTSGIGFWLVGETTAGSAVARLDREGTLVPPVNFDAGWNTFTAMEREPSAAGMYLLNGTLNLVRFDAPGSFELVSAGTIVDLSMRGSIVRSGAALFFVRAPYRIIERYLDGNITVERTDLDQFLEDSDRLTDLVTTSFGDVFASTERGDILQWTEARWIHFAAAPTESAHLTTLERLGPREILAAGKFGFVGQLSAETKGPCAEPIYTGARDNHLFLGHDDVHVWITGYGFDSQDVQHSYLLELGAASP